MFSQILNNDTFAGTKQINGYLLQFHYVYFSKIHKQVSCPVMSFLRLKPKTYHTQALKALVNAQTKCEYFTAI